MKHKIKLYSLLFFSFAFQAVAQNDTIPNPQSKLIVVKTDYTVENNLKRLGEVLIDNNFEIADIQKDFGIIKTVGNSMKQNALSKYRITGRCKGNGDIIIQIEYRWEKTPTLGGFQDVAGDWTVWEFSRNKKQQEYFNQGIKIARALGKEINFYSDF
jgi:hypothetical protein